MRDREVKQGMRSDTKIVFLHLPKTAGQLVDSFLQGFFPAEAICPAKVNEQLIHLSIAEIRRYRLFSGHLDWSMLDCVAQGAFVFTVLRRPIDRILSLYYFLRAQAAATPPEILHRTDHQGIRAALTLSCDEFFTGGPHHMRVFIDGHCDNLYAHYFAGRCYDAHQKFGPRDQRGGFRRGGAVLDLALENLSLLDGVFTTASLGALERAVSDFMGGATLATSLADVRVNAGSVPQHERWDGLRTLGATDITYDRLRRMVELDDVIWNQARERHAPSAP